jgi:hypothetical protein
MQVTKKTKTYYELEDGRTFDSWTEAQRAANQSRHEVLAQAIIDGELLPSALSELENKVAAWSPHTIISEDKLFAMSLLTQWPEILVHMRELMRQAKNTAHATKLAGFITEDKATSVKGFIHQDEDEDEDE